jgi:hypothetical protein
MRFLEFFAANIRNPHQKISSQMIQQSPQNPRGFPPISFSR